MAEADSITPELITVEGHSVVPTDQPPNGAARLVDDFTPELVDVGKHHLCPGAANPSLSVCWWRR